MMRVFLLFLVLMPSGFALEAWVAADLLRPVDPDARDGVSAHDFAAAQRLLVSDLLMLDGSKASCERTSRSLALVGEIGGFEHPALTHVHTRSLDSYRGIKVAVAAAC